MLSMTAGWDVIRLVVSSMQHFLVALIMAIMRTSRKRGLYNCYTNVFFKSYDYTSAYHSFQLTGVWGLNFANKKCTFSGFIDFWRGENWRSGHEGHGMLVVLTEPQFWYNVTPNLSFGSEIEISNNFIYNTYNNKSFFINPTIAAKWNF